MRTAGVERFMLLLEQACVYINCTIKASMKLKSLKPNTWHYHVDLINSIKFGGLPRLSRSPNKEFGAGRFSAKSCRTWRCLGSPAGPVPRIYFWAGGAYRTLNVSNSVSERLGTFSLIINSYGLHYLYLLAVFRFGFPLVQL